MAELTAKTRFLAPLGDSRASSPSMSPTRRYRRLYPSSDDIPYDIPPSSILEAFTDGTLPPPGTSEHKYLLCARGASLAQKATATRVAKIALNAQEWCIEIRHWNWPGAFDTPSNKSGFAGKLFASLPSADGHDMEYWGSLPAIIVESYERRIEEMQDQMERLDVEDLKSYIADLHGSRSRPSSSYSTKRSQLDLMDDFSLLITGTLVQALPLLSQLNQNIETWSIRLSILRKVPIFLKDLDEAQRALRLAWDAIALPSEDDTTPTSIRSWKNAADTITLVLKAKISDLGRRVDAMLDTLEAREDVIPDTWIDDFEELEADYGRWVVEAQRRSLELDLRLIQALKTAVSHTPPPDPSESLPLTIRSASPPPKMLEDSSKIAANIRSITPEDSKRNSFDPSFTGVGSTTLYEQSLQAPPSPHDRTEQDTPGENRPQDATNEFEAMPAVVKRASITSIESFSRAQVRLDGYSIKKNQTNKHSQLKSITIRRNSSSSSIQSSQSRPRSQSQDSRATPSPIKTERLEQSPYRRSSQGSSPLEATQEESLPAGAYDFQPIDHPKTPDRVIPLDTMSPPYSGFTEASGFESPMDDSPSLRQKHSVFQGATEHPPPLNFAMTKRRQLQDEIPASLIPDDEDRELDNSEAAAEPQSLRSPIKSPIKSPATDLNAQISDILTTVPANIRLTSSIEMAQPKAESSRYSSSTQASQRLHASRPSVKSPELTLAPARPDEYAHHRRGGDPEIKVYHLIQPGMGKPIKLFIRTVGENGERVMVRVGGGWADLGEYLRQYAEHHGRRTVSEGKLEVLSSTGDTAASVVSPGNIHVNKNPARVGAVSPGNAPRQARDSPVGTPSNITSGVSTTSTPDTNNSTNSKGSWKGEEVGLAGPTTKKLDLSSEKKEWIDSMMTQARRISGGMMSKSPNPDKDFGDLGKVGGTKRVWLRAPSRQSGE
jgi:hypothetical protein